MTVSKKKITEQEAASEFVIALMGEAEKEWPHLYKELQRTFPVEFYVKDETKGALDLALARIAMELQAVGNLCPRDQALRIEQWIMSFISGALRCYNGYPATEINTYRTKFKQDPINSIPAHLLNRWVGGDIKGFVVEVGGEKTNQIGPTYLLAIFSILTSLSGYWKRILNNVELIPSDISLIPSEKDTDDIREFVEISRDTVPYVYFDLEGNQKEQWMSLERLKKLSIIECCISNGNNLSYGT